MDRKKSWNILLAILCVVLFVLLAGMLLWWRKTEFAETKRLQKLAAEQETSVSIDKTQVSSDNGEEETPSAGDGQEESSETENQQTEPEGIVFWGDDMINGEESATYSYKSVLQKLLQEKGYNISVQDKTLQGAGTLSMMTMAGVPKEEVESYITKHKEAAAGAELAVTETGIRDLTPEQLERTDKNCIPIIWMGYYGGWNRDPQELAEQQEKILKTFPDQEKFIIIGSRPIDGTVDTASIDGAMKAKWGEHYVSAAEVCSGPAATYESQASVALAVLEKLEELKYIEKEGQ